MSRIEDAQARARAISGHLIKASLVTFIFALGVNTEHRDLARTLDVLSTGVLTDEYFKWIEEEAKVASESLLKLGSLKEDSQQRELPAKVSKILANTRETLFEEWQSTQSDTLKRGSRRLEELVGQILQGPVYPVPLCDWSSERDRFLKSLGGLLVNSPNDSITGILHRIEVGDKSESEGDAAPSPRSLSLEVKFDVGGSHHHEISFDDDKRMRGLLDFVGKKELWDRYARGQEEVPDPDSITSGLMALASTEAARNTGNGSMELAGVNIAGVDYNRAIDRIEISMESSGSLTVYGFSLSGRAILVTLPWVFVAFLIALLFSNLGFLRAVRDALEELGTADDLDFERPRFEFEGIRSLCCMALPLLALHFVWSVMHWQGVFTALSASTPALIAFVIALSLGVANTVVRANIWHLSKSVDQSSRARALLKKKCQQTWVFYPELLTDVLSKELWGARHNLGCTRIVSSLSRDELAQTILGDLAVGAEEVYQRSIPYPSLGSLVLQENRMAIWYEPRRDRLSVQSRSELGTWVAWLARNSIIPSPPSSH